jgi:hypothetical protein
MQPAKPHFAFAILAVLLLIPLNSSAFDTPLSDTAVREAYFLGQHHDLRCLEAYTRVLPVPQPVLISRWSHFSHLLRRWSNRPARELATTARSKHKSITAA